MPNVIATTGCTVTDSQGQGVITGSGTVLIGGLNVALVGDQVSPHGTHAGETVLTQQNTTVTINGKLVAVLGDICSQGGVIGPPLSPPTGAPVTIG